MIEKDKLSGNYHIVYYKVWFGRSKSNFLKTKIVYLRVSIMYTYNNINISIIMPFKNVFVVKKKKAYSVNCFLRF